MNKILGFTFLNLLFAFFVLNSNVRAENIFENVKEQAEDSWYSFRYSLKTDRTFYADQASKKVNRSEDRLRTLREKSHAVAAEDREEVGINIEAVEGQVQITKDNLNTLKSITDPEGWEAARKAFDKSLNHLEDLLDETAKKVFSEKEYYEWKSENKINHMKDDVEELKEASKQIKKEDQGEVKKGIEESIRRLDERQKAAENKLKEVKAAREENWESKKEELDNTLESFRGVYFNTLAKLG